MQKKREFVEGAAYNVPSKIQSMIYEIRGYKVMVDSDLAALYQVETRRLNEAVKRNIDRFPPEFMFQLTQAEYDNLRSQFAISKGDCGGGGYLPEDDNLKSQFVTSSLRSQIATLKDNYGGGGYLPGDDNLKSQFATSSWGGRRKLPFAFTEHGVIMLSSVLNSKIATQVNIAVVKAFIDMRRYIAKPIREKIDNLEKVLMLHIDDTSHSFTKHAAVINKIVSSLNNLIEPPPDPKRKIGFNPD